MKHSVWIHIDLDISTCEFSKVWKLNVPQEGEQWVTVNVFENPDTNQYQESNKGKRRVRIWGPLVLQDWERQRKMFLKLWGNLY